MRHSVLRKALAGAALLALASASQASTLPVNLGSAGNFTVLAKTGVSASGTTSVVGNIGISPAPASYITAFGLIADSSNQFSTSSLVAGKVYASDYANPTPAILTTAIGDMQTAFTDAAGRAADVTGLGAGNISGLTLAPGVYQWGTGLLIASNVTLSGSATDVWIFQIAQNLTVSNGVQVVLAGGAQAKNIFWQVSGQASIGTTAVFNGTILCQTLIALNTGAQVNGKALAQTAVTLAGAVISSANAFAGNDPPPVGQTFAYPSPARHGVVNIAYNMPGPGQVRIRVWNAAGDLATALTEDELAGFQTTQIAVNQFASGVYLYKISITYDSGSVENLGVQKFTVSH